MANVFSNCAMLDYFKRKGLLRDPESGGFKPYKNHHTVVCFFLFSAPLKQASRVSEKKKPRFHVVFVGLAEKEGFEPNTVSLSITTFQNSIVLQLTSFTLTQIFNLILSQDNI